MTHKSAQLRARFLTAEFYVGWRFWRTFDIGFGYGCFHTGGLDLWLNLGWLYLGVEVWR